jgi:hypothetical protein
LDELYNHIFTTGQPKSDYHPIRREDTTIFKVDPVVAAKSADDFARFFPNETKPEPPPRPKVQRGIYQPPDPALECRLSKKVTVSQIQSILDRLTQRQATHPVGDENVNFQPKVTKDSDVFDRLYIQSTAPDCSDASLETPPQEDTTNSLSKCLANHRISESVREAVGDREALSHAELTELFDRLGIVEKEEEIANFTGQVSLQLILDELLVALGGLPGPFCCFASHRMAAHFANMRHCLTPPEPVRQSKRISRNTLKRICARRPEPHQVEEEEEVFEPAGLWAAAQSILSQSRLGNESFEERDR